MKLLKEGERDKNISRSVAGIFVSHIFLPKKEKEELVHQITLSIDRQLGETIAVEYFEDWKLEERKNRAHREVAKAIRLGTLVRNPECELCGKKTKTEAHHSDYDEPLKVTFLCRRCHHYVDVTLPRVNRIEKEIKENKERKEAEQDCMFNFD